MGMSVSVPAVSVDVFLHFETLAVTIQDLRELCQFVENAALVGITRIVYLDLSLGSDQYLDLSFCHAASNIG